MSKKKKYIGKARLIGSGFGNDDGDIVKVYEVDSKNRIYYYDGFRRWVYVNDGEYEWVIKPNELQ